MLATNMRCMHYNRLEIRNADSSSRQQLITFLGMDGVVHGAFILFTQIIYYLHKSSEWKSSA